MVFQIIARLYKIFLVRLSVRDFMAGPTIADIAVVVKKRLEQQSNGWNEANDRLHLVARD